MKAVLGWLSDPYVHMFAVGLVLVRLAMGAGADDPPEVAVVGLAHCPACLREHPGLPCLRVALDASRPNADRLP